MTREEQIRFRAGCIADGCIAQGAPWKEYYQGFIEGAKWADSNPSQPSIPSNVDEAATKAYPKMSRISEPHGMIPADNKSYYLGDANKENRAAFKAGAEWMVKQGVTVKGLLYGGNLGIPDIPEEFYTDKEEEVTVQIRKK